MEKPELTEKRKEELRAIAKRKLAYIEQEYWRVRNGKQDYLRCPYCVKGRHGHRRNHIDGNVCCSMFAKAFGAILERQNQVDIAASHVRNLHKVGMVN